MQFEPSLKVMKYEPTLKHDFKLMFMNSMHGFIQELVKDVLFYSTRQTSLMESYLIFQKIYT